MTQAELKELAIKIHRGDVWVGHDKATLEPFQMLFMFFSKPQLKKFAATKPAIFYEEMRKAAPLQCNGQPIFFSCCALKRRHWQIVRGMLKKLAAAEQAL